VGASFDIPESTCRFAAMGTLGLLEILRDCSPMPRFLHVSSSEVFGNPETSPQTEQTPFRPATPYGVAKTFATQMVQVYRQSFGLFACNAICFNHESPRRGESFVTRKITRSAARIKLGIEQSLNLGNVDGERDWGFAGDYVKGFHSMLQLDTACDLVFASGTTHRVKDWLDLAFGYCGLDWRDYVREDPRYFRKADPSRLVGDPSLAAQTIGWQPETSFEQMVTEMVEADLQREKKKVASC
jgi:GDPmannose 4,6-dehydratase